MNKKTVQANRLAHAKKICVEKCNSNASNMARILSSHAGYEINPSIIHRWFWEPSKARPIGEDHARLIEGCFGLRYAESDFPPNHDLDALVPTETLKGLDPESVMLLRELAKAPTQVQEDLRDMIKIVVSKHKTKSIPQ